MKKITVISILMIGVFLMSGIATVALASSLIPSPYNLIHSTELKLISLDKRIDAVLGYYPPDPIQPPDPIFPPDPIHPPDPIRSPDRIIKTLETIADRLNVLNSGLRCVIEDLPLPEEAPEEILDALGNVKDKANIILLRASTGFIMPPDPVTPPDPCTPPDPIYPPDPVLEALASVESGAQVTIDIVDSYLRSVPPRGE